MLSDKLLISLNDTLPAYLPVHSQEICNGAPQFTQSILPSQRLSTCSSTLPSMLSRPLLVGLDYTLSLLDCMLQSKLSKHSHVHSQLHLMAHT